MKQKRYYIRAAAKTTAGGTVRAPNTRFTMNGAPVACEGDPVDSPACGTEGVIKCVMPRLPDSLDGKEVALSDDLCICSCTPPPKLISDQEFDFQWVDTPADELARQDGLAAESSVAAPDYDEQSRLVAPPIEGLPYFIETPDGRTLSSRAGPGGLLPRIKTEGEKEYIVLWGDGIGQEYGARPCLARPCGNKPGCERTPQRTRSAASRSSR